MKLIDKFTTADESLERIEDVLAVIADELTTQPGGGRKESPHLQTEVPADTTEYRDVVTYTVPDGGMIKDLTVWHVPNSEDAVRTRPVRITNQNERVNLPSYGDGEEFITGEPDDRNYRVEEPIRERETIAVAAKNTNGTYDYRIVVVPRIDYSADPTRGEA
jgi:hypothetical protein